LHALIGGGNWNNGVHCGSRCVNCNNYPWNVNVNIGVWCVCDFHIITDTEARKKATGKDLYLSFDKSDGFPVPGHPGQNSKGTAF